MRTDPTPQAVTCLHCGKTVSEGIERDCYGSKTGMHNWVEPAEPSPAPQAEREWLVVDSMPEAMKILADKLKQAESALTIVREERDRAQDALREMVRSAHPNRKEHPTMYKAWRNAEIVLGEFEDDIRASKPVSDREDRREFLATLKDASPAVLKAIAVFHRKRAMAAEAKCARLEAEKQDARRIGLEFALHLANETADWCIEEQEKGYLGAMRVADAIKRELSKTTAPRSTGETESPRLDVNHE